MVLAVEQVPDFAVTMMVLGGFFAVVASVLASANYVKQLFFSTTEGQLAVTKRVFDEVINELKGEIKNSRIERIDQIDKLKSMVLTEKEYAHDQTHDLRTLLQTQTNETAMLRQKVEEGIQDAVKRLENRFDHHDRAIAKLGHRVSQLIGRLERHEENDKENDNGDSNG